jgi:hypothetical protein
MTITHERFRVDVCESACSTIDLTVSRNLPTALESQRHPEWASIQNDTVRICRGFLSHVVADAVERGEIAPNIDLSALAESLLVVLCGVGLYAGYVEGYQETLAVIDRVRPALLEGGLWGSDREGDRRAAAGGLPSNDA